MPAPQSGWMSLESHHLRVGPQLPLRWYSPRGQRGSPRLIFTPGIASDGLSWFRQAPLGDRRPVAFLDNVLEVPEAPYDFDILALLVRDAVWQLCDRPPVLVGTSFGAMLALTYALTWPEAISGLVLSSTIAAGRWLEYPYRVGHKLISAIPERLFRGTFPALCRWSGWLDRQDGESRSLFDLQGRGLRPRHYADRLRAVGRLSLEERLGELQVPTLIVHGTADRTVPLRHGARLAELIPAAEFHPCEGAGHSLYLSQAAWFNATVEGWLQQHGLG